jgi:16S rRNA (guanine527-N7)-methyltransferase
MADVEDVLERARSLGVLGPGPVTSHIEHAAVFLDALVGCRGSVLDLGSGAGVPGLVIARERSDLEVVLLDAHARRVALLLEAVEALGLAARVRVLHGRAEELGRVPELRGGFEAVTARSFGPPAVVAECAAPFLAVGGRLVVSEPPGDADRWPADELHVLGMALSSSRSPGVALLEQVTPCPDRFPRRNGVAAKRPLFSSTPP